VIAVEPGSDMLRVGSSTAAPRVRWIAAAAERTGLVEGAFHLVVAAQAFHWFDRDAALDEFVRILRPGGRVAVLWNCRDESDPTTVELNGILDRHATHGRRRTTRTRPLDGRPDLRDVRLRALSHEHPLGLEGLLGGARSSSYAPTAGPSLEAFLGEVRDLHARRADESGMVRVLYETEIWIAEVG
jgi:SAM-dependent methyltransferase